MERRMKIQRKIERHIEVTADEVYAALAAKYDLATDKADFVCFETGGGQESVITLLHISSYEQEVAE
jgi:predicted alternative tryptophan synthase beta-subunit